MAGINKKKQKIKNEEWIKMLQKIGQVISREELDRIVFSTIKDIKKKTMDKKAAYAWSGGKDSVVLGKICHIAGITDCVLVICNLEYRAFMEWIRIHKPGYDSTGLFVPKQLNKGAGMWRRYRMRI